LSNFNYIAPVYDRLAGLVFGDAIRDAQRVHLKAFSAARRILIVGGGTGWLLRDVLTTSPGAQVIYLEASYKMIELSRECVNPGDAARVVFLHGKEDLIPDGPHFDGIIANFFLDVFPESELGRVVGRFHRSLMPTGRLLVTDFVSQRRWQRALLKVMYLFFRISAGLRNQQLPRWQSVVRAHDFSGASKHTFLHGFICSELFRKG